MRSMMCRRFLNLSLITSLILAPTLVPSLAWADEPGTMSDADIEVPKFWSIITDIPSNLKTWGSEVIERDNLPLVVGVGAMTGILVATDYETWQAAKVPHDLHEGVHQFAIQGVSMGDGFFQFGIVGAFAAGGAAFGNHRALRTASQITEAILSTGVVVQVMKHIIGRESPFSSESRTGVWRMFPNQAEYNRDFQKFDAVPSGHLSTAMTTLIVIQENYPEYKWIPWVGYPIMGWIAYGLVATSIHWWSDFPIAVAIGYSMGKVVTRGNNTPKGSTSDGTQASSGRSWKPTLLPSVSSSGEPMLTAGWTF